MKVLQIIPMFKLAGAETMCENLCKALRNQGCDVVVVSLYTEHTPITDRLENAGIRVIYLGKRKGFDFSTFVKLYQLIKKERPEVVHTHIYAARYALPVAVFCRTPRKVHTVHSIAQQEQATAGKIINKFLFKHFDVVPVALSEEVKKTVEEVYGLQAEKIPVIFNGVDLSKCTVKEDYTKKDEFKILHIGRFMDVKNHAMILRTFALFVNQHPDARLQLLGDGELKEEMMRLARDLDIADAVEFAGLQSNVYPWLHDADVFILPSKFEGMPMTLIEAMGTGVPIIASAVGGVPDMLIDKKDALLIEPKEENIIAALELMYFDEERRKLLGQNALRKSATFSAQTMAKKYLQLYMTKSERPD